MLSRLISAIAAVLVSASSPAFASDVLRNIIVEADPVAPTSSMYEQQQSGVSTSKWGAGLDYNLAARISTGPEYWMGQFVVKGAEAGTSGIRREDFWPGERQKIDATRFRWNIGFWEQAQSMRGWYCKMAYSYTKISSRANRFTESVSSSGSALTTSVSDAPSDETDFVTDTRHGVSASFGSRWFIYERITASIGASITKNLKRTIDVDSSDPNAKADYETLINNTLPDTRISSRPTPEVNMGLGYAF